MKKKKQKSTFNHPVHRYDDDFIDYCAELYLDDNYFERNNFYRPMMFEDFLWQQERVSKCVFYPPCRRPFPLGEG